MRIRLSDHFTYGRLLRFTLPSMAMMVFTSIYCVVDGYFVSNFAGKTAFASVNFIMPFLMILGTVGFMFGAGGSAIVAKTLGEGDKDGACRLFSLFVYFSFGLGVLISVLGLIFIRPFAAMLGAEGELLEGCIVYGRIIILSVPAFILQMEFQSFLITAERPNLGLIFTLISGVLNMLLDLLLVGVLEMGIVGAALATSIAQIVGALLPLVFFLVKNESLLRLVPTRFSAKPIVRAAFNGSSEFMSNISMSLVGMLYNVQLLNYAGENGVSAYGVLMYVSMVFNSIFIGYSIGTAPVVGFNYGAGNTRELRGILRKSLTIIGLFSVAMLALSEICAVPMSNLYVGYDKELFELTAKAFRIYSFAFLFMGFAIYLSGFFTALSDGLTSALISFLRTLVIQVLAVLLLPLVFEVDGIWLSLVVAELLAMAMSLMFLRLKKKRFGY